ncbi:MipA/OmpV family protein [Sphingomonas sp.]|uniref:MipA/OmpV family protein n=1 Tax=Sphingomonas sp. TaxID=28214 RepID=UPI003B3B4151
MRKADGNAGYALWATLIALLGAAAPASAQEQNHVILGAGVYVAPAFQGSKKSRVNLVPAIDVKHGWLFANLRNGAGIAPINTEQFTVGVSAVLMQGYRRKDVPSGVRRLSDGVGARAFAKLRVADLATTIGVVNGVSGQTRGFIADATIAYPIPVGARLTLTPSVGTTWVNRKYNSRYFGIDAGEATASGLRQFRPGSGFKDVSGFLTASHQLTERLMVSATGSAVMLVGDAQRSPLIDHKTRPTGLFAVSYRF